MFYKYNLFIKQLLYFILFKIYWLGLFIGVMLGGLVYDNVFVFNVFFEKVCVFFLVSEYEYDSYFVKKIIIKIIQEEVEEVNIILDKFVLEFV